MVMVDVSEVIVIESFIVRVAIVEVSMLVIVAVSEKVTIAL
jgi:hypothetical protein